MVCDSAGWIWRIAGWAGGSTMSICKNEVAHSQSLRIMTDSIFASAELSSGYAVILSNPMMEIATRIFSAVLRQIPRAWQYATVIFFIGAEFSTYRFRVGFSQRLRRSPRALDLHGLVHNCIRTARCMIRLHSYCFGKISPLMRRNAYWIPFGDHPLKLERYRED